MQKWQLRQYLSAKSLPLANNFMQVHICLDMPKNRRKKPLNISPVMIQTQTTRIEMLTLRSSAYVNRPANPNEILFFFPQGLIKY